MSEAAQRSLLETPPAGDYASLKSRQPEPTAKAHLSGRTGLADAGRFAGRPVDFMP